MEGAVTVSFVVYWTSIDFGTFHTRRAHARAMAVPFPPNMSSLGGILDPPCDKAVGAQASAAVYM